MFRFIVFLFVALFCSVAFADKPNCKPNCHPNHRVHRQYWCPPRPVVFPYYLYYSNYSFPNTGISYPMGGYVYPVYRSPYIFYPNGTIFFQAPNGLYRVR